MFREEIQDERRQRFGREQTWWWEGCVVSLCSRLPCPHSVLYGGLEGGTTIGGGVDCGSALPCWSQPGHMIGALGGPVVPSVSRRPGRLQVPHRTRSVSSGRARRATWEGPSLVAFPTSLLMNKDGRHCESQEDKDKDKDSRRREKW